MAQGRPGAFKERDEKTQVVWEKKKDAHFGIKDYR